jgi:hypothetical protein
MRRRRGVDRLPACDPPVRRRHARGPFDSDFHGSIRISTAIADEIAGSYR